MSYLDKMIAGMASQDDKEFARAEKKSLELTCEGLIAECIKNCIWVGYSMHGEPIDVLVTGRGKDDFARVDITAEPMLYIPNTLFREVVQRKASEMDYPYKLSAVMDALQATRSKKVMTAKLPKKVDIDIPQQQRVVVIPVVPFLVKTGIDRYDFYPEKTHDWRYINY